MSIGLRGPQEPRARGQKPLGAGSRPPFDVVCLLSSFCDLPGFPLPPVVLSTLPCWKLVRDGVARRLSGSGNVVLKRIEREQLRELLRVKIVEEALEFAESGSVEELADLFEAVTEWLRLAGMSLRELEALAEAKRREEGGFSEGWVAFWKDRDAC